MQNLFEIGKPVTGERIKKLDFQALIFEIKNAYAMGLSSCNDK